MSRRTGFLATVHIARKELGWDDETYRSILRRTVNKFSAGDCTDGELKTLLAEFERLGWKKRPAAARPLSKKAQVRMGYAIWRDIAPLLDGDAADAQLRSFVRRQTKSADHPAGVDALEFCDQADLTKVIEGLKGWRARLQKRRAA